MHSQGLGGLHTSLPARAANVSVVRHALAGLAEAIGMDEPGVADLNTVVTEACMNVVVHAYDDEGGLLEVDAVPEGDSLRVTVRDFGSGIRPDGREGGSQSLRLGLPLIAALSQRYQVAGGEGLGTEITMWLALSGSTPEEAPSAKDDAAPEVHLTVADADLLRPVLGRVIGALAARQDLTVDRLSDAMLLTDALSADAASGFGSRPVEVALLDGDGTIDLKLGPMDRGAADRLRKGLRIESVGGTLESLAANVRSESDDAGEYLVAHFATFTDASSQ